MGFGCAPLGAVFGPMSQDEATRAVRRALALGVNYFDTSPFYGETRSERVLGEALRGVPRGSFVLATKVGRYEPGVTEQFDFRAASVTERFYLRQQK